MTRSDKYQALKIILKDMGHVVVAYSGGVDSSFLLKVAFDILGEKAYGVLAVSPSFPSREYKQAMGLARQIGVRVETIHTKELEDVRFVDNPSNRCYFCKSELFDKIAELAGSGSYPNMLDGTNSDDLYDHRPGMKALKERGVRSPLKEVGFKKDEIRSLSKDLGLPTWEKDELACLSSRFPYGETISSEKLARVDKLENFLSDLGFRNIRARHMGETVKIEVRPDQVKQLLGLKVNELVTSRAIKLGYSHIIIDPLGYRRGSMNETINSKDRFINLRPV